MARRMVSDEQKVFRVIVASLPRVDNPDWKRGFVGSDNPRFLYQGETYDSTYGPYNSLSAARGQLTYRTLGYDGEPRPGVVGGRIQKATTTWEDVV